MASFFHYSIAAFILHVMWYQSARSTVILGEIDPQSPGGGAFVLRAKRSDAPYSQDSNQNIYSSFDFRVLRAAARVGQSSDPISNLQWTSGINCGQVAKAGSDALRTAQDRSESATSSDMVDRVKTALRSGSIAEALPPLSASARAMHNLDASSTEGYQRFREETQSTEMLLAMDLSQLNITSVDRLYAKRAELAGMEQTFRDFRHPSPHVQRCARPHAQNLEVFVDNVSPDRGRAAVAALPPSMEGCLRRAAATGVVQKASSRLDTVLAQDDPQPLFPRPGSPRVDTGRVGGQLQLEDAEWLRGAKAARQLANRRGIGAAVERGEKVRREREGGEAGGGAGAEPRALLGTGTSRGVWNAVARATGVDSGSGNVRRSSALAAAHPATAVLARAVALPGGGSGKDLGASAALPRVPRVNRVGGVLALKPLASEVQGGPGAPLGLSPPDGPQHLAAAVAAMCAEDLLGAPGEQNPSGEEIGPATADQAWFGRRQASLLQPDALLTAAETSPIRPEATWNPPRLLQQLQQSIAQGDAKAALAVLGDRRLSIRESACSSDGEPLAGADPALRMSCASALWALKDPYGLALRQAAVMPPMVALRGRWPPAAGWAQGTSWSSGPEAGEQTLLEAPYVPQGSGAAAPHRQPVPLWALGFRSVWQAAAMPLPWTGQLLQDRWVVEHVFPGLRGGYFFEAGAVDGRELSNTWVLEREYGWTGLLVEARKESQASLRYYRPRSSTSMALMGNKDREQMVLYTRPITQGDSTNTTAYFRPVSEAGPAGSKDSRGFQSTGEVYESRRIGSLLAEAGAPHFIHYLSLDIEGFEWDVLQTFPWEKYTVGALSIEHSDSGKVDHLKEAQIAEMLIRNGYVRERGWRQDALWVHRTVAREMVRREAEGKRRRRGRARRPGFAAGTDYSQLPEDLDRYHKDEV